MTSPHLSPEALAAYLDDAMSIEDRRVAEEHLAACDECRREVVASREAISTFQPASVRKPWRTIGLVAAAAIVVAIGTTLSREPSRSDTVRSDNSITSTRPLVTVIGPGNGARLNSDRRIVWKSLAEGSSYRITIGDEAAEPIHAATVQDTTYIVPPSVNLTRGKKYFWYVDAIRADGVTASSGLRSFIVE